FGPRRDGRELAVRRRDSTQRTIGSETFRDASRACVQNQRIVADVEGFKSKEGRRQSVADRDRAVLREQILGVVELRQSGVGVLKQRSPESDGSCVSSTISSDIQYFNRAIHGQYLAELFQSFGVDSVERKIEGRQRARRARPPLARESAHTQTTQFILCQHQ